MADFIKIRSFNDSVPLSPWKHNWCCEVKVKPFVSNIVMALSILRDR